MIPSHLLGLCQDHNVVYIIAKQLFSLPVLAIGQLLGTKDLLKTRDLMTKMDLKDAYLMLQGGQSFP